MVEITIKYPNKSKNKENSIIFDIIGNKEHGLNKSIINSLRRTLLSSIPCVGFRTEMKNNDIKIVKNT
jgi:DNA-directed RNA polymerase alpha subunit